MRKLLVVMVAAGALGLVAMAPAVGTPPAKPTTTTGATTTTTAPPPAQQVLGVPRNVEVSAMTEAGSSLYELEALCNPGEKVLGGGYSIPTDGSVTVFRSGPKWFGVTSERWSVGFAIPSNESKPVGVSAICAPILEDQR